MLTRVQNVVLDPRVSQQLRQEFGFLNRGRAHEGRLTLFFGLFDRIHNRVVFFLSRTIDRIVLVLTCHRTVGRNLDNAKAIDLGKFFSLSQRRAGHTAQLVIKTEVILEGHLRQSHVFRFDRDALFGLNRLMQTFGQTTARHHTAGEFVDQNDLIASHDVVFVFGKEFMRAQTLIHVVHNRGAFRIIERLPLRQDPRLKQFGLKPVVAVVGKGHGAGLFIQREMFFANVRNDLVDRHIHIGAVGSRPRDDQRGPGFVDQDRVDLVHDGEIVVALEDLVQLGLHIVAQIVKTQLVVCGVGHVTAIGSFLFFIWLLRVDNACGQAQSAIDLAHPFRVTLREVVVHGNDMHALAGQSIQIGREGRHEGFTLTGFHLGDIALMQEHPAHELRIKGTQAKRAFRGLAAVREGFGQDRVQAFAAFNA